MLPTLPAAFSNWNVAPPSLGFAAFVLAVLIAYYLLAGRRQNLLLLIASYVFCAAWNPWFVAVVLVSSVLNYLVALRLGASAGSSKRAWLWTGIGLNLAGLVAFKYIDQTARYSSVLFRLLGITLPQAAILQPIGISFYTLQALSYLMDVYASQLPPTGSFLEVSLYLAYFPKLLAGPIERAGHFFEQIRAQTPVTNREFGEATVKITVGLVRKLVIADRLMPFVPPEIFTQPRSFTAPDLLFWWLAYAFVIYNDFAGYTSIARGVSELFGVRLSPNFEQPFLATSFVDFWNRWHISLSHWLRDYVYLPVSRALLRRNPSGRYLPNLLVPPLITMFISGLWHGAVPHLLFWGLLNGALQGIERVYKSRVRVTAARPPRWRKALSIAGTLILMFLISVPFRLEVPETFTFWLQLLHWGARTSLTFAGIIRPVLAIALSLALDLAPMPARDETGWLRRRPALQSAALAVAILFIFLATRQQATAPFIYQQF